MTRKAPTHSLPPEVHSEGGLLSADFLERLGAGDKSITALAPEAYHLAGRDTLADAMTRAWNELRGHWQSFAARREQDPTAVTRTKDVLTHWLYPLFQVLGFGRLAPVAAPLVVGDTTYPISHLWQRLPLHLVAWDQSLDTPQPRMTPRRSPHGLMQDFLNKSDQHLWGVITNGRLLRLMRDHRSLTRQAYIELDLEQMFAGEQFHAFRFLWLLLHESRFTSEHGDTPEHFRVEAWFKEAKDEGVRALDKLRDGVTQAIELLGRGFLAADNHELRSQLADHRLSGQDFYRELLRLAYRLIFLFVAEDRDALLVPGDAAARKRYERFYSSQHLRKRALESSGRGDTHEDLWQQLRLVMEHLDQGYEPLALPGLGSFLWSKTAAPHVMQAALANQHLLEAVRALASTRDAKGLRHAVSWRLIGADELGGIYESLLELHPRISDDGRTFELVTAPGHERKTTGSYYTPSALVECLLDSALDPVMAEAIKGKSPTEAEAAILSLTVVDPAVGSGHFIRAAGRRLAKKLAQIRSGNDEPDPPAMRRALRDVVGKCLYGVDLNPMAAELCKVALWLEAVEPGRPLSFLDSHIQVGNALLGATPELVAKGIPDSAWEPLTGDDKTVAKALKKRNKQGAVGQLDLGVDASITPSMVDERLIERARFVEALRQHTRAELGRVEGEWAAYLVSEEFRAKTILADVWCAAFVWPKQAGESNDAAPVDGLFYRFAKEPLRLPEATQSIASAIAEQYKVFHWHLRFPAVMASGGFDILLGNPPWERVKLQEQEFFATRSAAIFNAANSAARKRLIAGLALDDPQMWSDWRNSSRSAEGESHFARNSGRYPLCGTGDVNTYAIFAEHNLSTISPTGRAGFIVPSGIATDDTTKSFFQAICERNRLIALWEFENEGFFSAGKGHMLRFALTTLCGRSRPSIESDFAFQCLSLLELARPERHFRLSSVQISHLNPNTRTCPIFKSSRDADLNLAIYQRAGILWDTTVEAGNRWNLEIRTRLWHMSEDAELFRTTSELVAVGASFAGSRMVHADSEYLPLIEAKMLSSYNHRHGTFSDALDGERAHRLPEPTETQLKDPNYAAKPFYWVRSDHVDVQLKPIWQREWLIGWRDVTDARASRRTVVPCVIPRSPVSDKFLLLFPSVPPRLVACLYACLCSFPLDYAARQKVGGTSLKSFTMKQLPVLGPDTYSVRAPWDQRLSLVDWIVPRVLELTYTTWDLRAFALDLGHGDEPFGWDFGRRSQLRAELDAAFFHIYGLTRDDTVYILESFSAVRRNDEAANEGRFVSMLRILDAYDALERAAQAGNAYVSALFPPVEVFEKGPPVDDAKALGLLRVCTLVRLADDALDLHLLTEHYDFGPAVLASLGPIGQTPEARAWAAKRPDVPGLKSTLEELLATQMVRVLPRGDGFVVTATEHTPPRAKLDDWFIAEAGLLMTLGKKFAEVELTRPVPMRSEERSNVFDLFRSKKLG